MQSAFVATDLNSYFKSIGEEFSEMISAFPSTKPLICSAVSSSLQTTLLP